VTHALQKCEFRLREFWNADKKFKWNYGELHGPMKIPKFDDLAGFAVKDFTEKINGAGTRAARFELQELYEDEDVLE
jgi:hypothetical protein